MKIEIDIDEYFTPEMIKEIAEDELRGVFRRQFQKESDVERVISNLSSEFVFTLVAEKGGPAMTREETIMANYSQKAKKIKTPFAKMIVEGNQEKPYFSILYFDPIDKDFYVGYSSYCLDYVSNWLNEEFEIVEDENFIIAALRHVSREQARRGEWEKIGADYRGQGGIWRCTECRKTYPYKCDFCPNCGAPMTDEAVQMVMERMEALYE